MSLPQDKTWQFDYLEDIEAKYDDALLEIYEDEIQTLLFDLGATVTNDQHFYSLTVPGLLSWNDTELGWLFDMNKVRQHFVERFESPALEELASGTFSDTYELQGGKPEEKRIYKKYSTNTLQISKIKE